MEIMPLTTTTLRTPIRNVKMELRRKHHHFRSFKHSSSDRMGFSVGMEASSTGDGEGKGSRLAMSSMALQKRKVVSVLGLLLSFFTVFPKLLHQSSLLSEEEPWVSFYSDVLQLESCWRRRCNASLKKREACFLKLDYNFALASKNLISFDGKLNPALWLAKMLFLLLLVI